ncbi:hypothetical protein FA95DRAFT_1677641 [Auriscalpium vulgare]|uniref:Uncharacterized protein n=1 Tax=Auriscalpium vulgare TaxID=40419 RepID=A0ACB8RZA9_9AGAM|nr:hypothetical protein FA95DRAFT_1677641 [Auriscalpium vulgare]
MVDESAVSSTSAAANGTPPNAATPVRPRVSTGPPYMRLFGMVTPIRWGQDDSPSTDSSSDDDAQPAAQHAACSERFGTLDATMQTRLAELEARITGRLDAEQEARRTQEAGAEKAAAESAELWKNRYIRLEGRIDRVNEWRHRRDLDAATQGTRLDALEVHHTAVEDRVNEWRHRRDLDAATQGTRLDALEAHRTAVEERSGKGEDVARRVDDLENQLRQALDAFAAEKGANAQALQDLRQSTAVVETERNTLRATLANAVGEAAREREVLVAEGAKQVDGIRSSLGSRLDGLETAVEERSRKGDDVARRVADLENQLRQALDAFAAEKGANAQALQDLHQSTAVVETERNTLRATLAKAVDEAAREREVLVAEGAKKVEDLRSSLGSRLDGLERRLEQVTHDIAKQRDEASQERNLAAIQNGRETDQLKADVESRFDELERRLESVVADLAKQRDDVRSQLESTGEQLQVLATQAAETRVADEMEASIQDVRGQLQTAIDKIEGVSLTSTAELETCRRELQDLQRHTDDSASRARQVDEDVSRLRDALATCRTDVEAAARRETARATEFAHSRTHLEGSLRQSAEAISAHVAGALQDFEQEIQYMNIKINQLRAEIGSPQRVASPFSTVDGDVGEKGAEDAGDAAPEVKPEGDEEAAATGSRADIDAGASDRSPAVVPQDVELPSSSNGATEEMRGTVLEAVPDAELPSAYADAAPGEETAAEDRDSSAIRGAPDAAPSDDNGDSECDHKHSEGLPLCLNHTNADIVDEAKAEAPLQTEEEDVVEAPAEAPAAAIDEDSPEADITLVDGDAAQVAVDSGAAALGKGNENRASLKNDDIDAEVREVQQKQESETPLKEDEAVECDVGAEIVIGAETASESVNSGESIREVAVDLGGDKINENQAPSSSVDVESATEPEPETIQDDPERGQPEDGESAEEEFVHVALGSPVRDGLREVEEGGVPEVDGSAHDVDSVAPVT